MASRQSTSSEVALVTGGAKRIGRVIADRLSREGFAVCVHANSSIDAARQFEAEIRARGGRAMVLQADLAAPRTYISLIDEATAALGPVSLLVNNASEYIADSAQTLQTDQWDRHLAINLTAPVFLMSAMARALPPSIPGAVVNVLDQRVWKLTPEYASYTISKSALWTATQTFAQALAPRIRVNAVGPGPTLANSSQTTDDFARQRSACPLGAGSSPDEIAAAVVFLAKARSITGQMLAVDGGQHLCWKTADIEDAGSGLNASGGGLHMLTCSRQLES